MLRRLIAACLVLGAFSELRCWLPGSGARLGDAISLDDNNATITISETAGGLEAEVVAVITDSRERLAELESGQTLLVNDEPLAGPDSGGAYRAIIPAAPSYIVTVNDPTRGVQKTTIFRPPAFAITSPVDGTSASLSGFTVAWSGADSSLDVEISLSQTIFGEQRLQEFERTSDTGMRGIEASELGNFQEGADLVIEVTKISRRNNISGFGSAALTSSLTVTSRVSPTS